jgi:hypothetical protein
MKKKKKVKHVIKKFGPLAFFLNFVFGFRQSSFLDSFSLDEVFWSKTFFFVSFLISGLRKISESPKHNEEIKLLVSQDYSYEKNHSWC